MSAPDDAAACRLTLVRHGETSANVEGVWHGSLDTALTERGRRQAALVAAHLARACADAAALYASPLTRALDTARAIGAELGLAPQVVPELREYHLGEWEGLSYAHLVRTHRIFERMREEPDWAPGGGESPRQVAERLVTALSQISARHPGQRVVVVGHGGAITLGLGWLLDAEAGAWRRVMENCATSELRLHPRPELLHFNATGHLAPLEEAEPLEAAR